MYGTVRRKASIPTCPIWRAWWAIVSSWIVVQDNIECTRQCQLLHGHQSFLAVCSCSIPASTSTICGFILLASLRHFHHSSSFCTISNFIAKTIFKELGRPLGRVTQLNFLYIVSSFRIPFSMFEKILPMISFVEVVLKPCHPNEHPVIISENCS